MTEVIDDELFKDFKELGINSVFDIFYLFLIGILLSLVIFLFEIYFNYNVSVKVNYSIQISKKVYPRVYKLKSNRNYNRK